MHAFARLTVSEEREREREKSFRHDAVKGALNVHIQFCTSWSVSVTVKTVQDPAGVRSGDLIAHSLVEGVVSAVKNSFSIICSFLCNKYQQNAHFLHYLLTPWCRVLLEKLTGLQLVKKFPAFLRNPKVHYRTHKRPPPVPILGQPNPVLIPTSPLLEIHPNIIHQSTPRSPQWSLSLRFPH